MSPAVVVPLAVWIVTDSFGAARAPLGRTTDAVPTRSRQPAMSTAELLVFWTVIVVSVGLSIAPVIRTGEAATAVATAGEAAVTAVATAGDAAVMAVATGDAATGDATGDAIGEAIGDAAGDGLATGEAAAAGLAAGDATAGDAALAAVVAVGLAGAGALVQALVAISAPAASTALTERIDMFIVALSQI